MADRAESLRGRLIGGLALLLAILMLVSAWASYVNGRAAADTAYDRTLLVSARAIADRLNVREGRVYASVPYIALDAFTYDSAGRVFYQVLGLDGELISGFDDVPAPPPKTPLTDDYPALARFYDGHYQGQGVRVVSLLQPISETEINGTVEIRVAETDGARARLAQSLLQDTLWRLGAAGLIALAMVWFAVSAALRPLGRLSDDVSRRRADDLRPLATVHAQRELRPLIHALNQFTERLRHYLDRQSRFIADAAHELRTPLAALKARIDIGLREDDPVQWRQTLEQARSGTNQLIHLANQLLSLARIENGAQAIAEGGAAPLDLSAIARDLGLAMAPLYHQRGVSLALEAESPVMLVGEPTLLSELLNNLMENALAHSQTSVVVRVLPGAVLEIEDDGPGIPPEQREKVFERFYRRQSGGKGAGLGLAIVGEICRVHRASISLDQGRLGGLLVRVAFPTPEVLD